MGKGKRARGGRQRVTAARRDGYREAGGPGGRANVGPPAGALVLYLSVEVHHAGEHWCASALPVGVGTLDDEEMVIPAPARMEATHFHGETVHDVFDEVQVFIEGFADIVDCAISALYTLDGDPAAWTATAAAHDLDRNPSHRTLTHAVS